MDESLKQNELRLNTTEKDRDIMVDEDKNLCQPYRTTQSIEENQANSLTTEPLSLEQLNTENITLIIDESDDEPLLLIHPVPNNRKICSHYWLEILVGSIILVFVLMIITAGIIFTKDSKAYSVSPKGCNKQSEMGKSCSIDNLETIILAKLKDPSYDKTRNSSFVYTAPSNRTIITFSFNKGWNFYLDNVSIRDTTNNVELIEDGGFESGTLYTYCVCDSSFQLTKATRSASHSGSYGCEVNNFFSAVQLSQAVKTIAGRDYKVGFWLKSRGGWDNTVTVYMSSAFKTSEPHFILLLLTRFIIVFFTFYII